MKLLKEQILFGRDKLDLIRKIYSNSSENEIIYTEKGDEQFVKRLVKDLNFSSLDNSKITYYCLYAASYGPDSSTNPLLRYLMDITDSIIIDYTDNVDILFKALISKEITLSKKVDDYLRCKSLYDRDQRDFEYAIKAFDAVINKIDKYFDVDQNNRITISLESKLVGQKWFGSSELTTRDEGSRYSDDETVGDVINAVVDVDQKYFFKGMRVDAADEIIPSGIDSTNLDERTIWGYMELWSDPVDETKFENEYNINKNITRAKSIIKNSNMSNTDKKELTNIIDDLT